MVQFWCDQKICEFLNLVDANHDLTGLQAESVSELNGCLAMGVCDFVMVLYNFGEFCKKSLIESVKWCIVVD